MPYLFAADYLSFQLSWEFLKGYQGRSPKWGFQAGAGNSLGEYSWISKYARRKDDGTRERFWEGLARVINGMYSIQKDHCQQYRLPWDERKAQQSAQEAYDRAFSGKWSPPGRGLWMMGTELVNGRKDSSALQNCAMVSTEPFNGDAVLPYSRIMDMSMMGVGVGFDTKGAGKVELHEPGQPFPHQISDSREGWVKSVESLLRAFFTGSRMPNFDYSQIRPAGAPIKGFGGIAAGPDPLRKGHETIVRLLTGRAGQVLTSTDVVDIANVIGKLVVSGNVRRSAQIALGNIHDRDFLTLKNWELNPERMGPDGWGHLSNNSVIAHSGDDLSHVADAIAMNGEPGVIWLDMCQGYGRVADAKDEKDWRVAGINPCQPSWATLLTPEGVRPMGEISIGDTVWSQDGWVTVTNKWSTGVKPVYRYRTTAGWVDSTENHRVVSNGVKVEAADAESIDRLRGGLEGQEHEPKKVLAGLMLGDGYIHAIRGDDYHVLCIGEKDLEYFHSEIASLIIARHGSAQNWAVEPVVNASWMTRLPERTIPASLMADASVLRGLFSANGSVVRNRVTFKTTSPEMRDAVQLSLSALGIASYYTTNKPSVIQWPNGEFESRESYDVNIGRARDVRRFADIIGFIQEYKNAKLEANILRDLGGRDKSFDVTESEYLGDHEVWDITVSGEHHTYWSGGMNISNCAEQPLENMECCTLVETFPTNCDDYLDYQRTLKFAYLYGKTVTLLPTRWPETNAVMQRNRRIGLSMTGLAQFAEKQGTHELARWQDCGYERIREWDEIYSEWLGVRESIRVTTVKPSGTVSLLYGVTPGVHWPVASGYYLRTVREAKGSAIARAFEAAGYPVEDSVYDPDTTVVITLPVETPPMRSQNDVSVWEKVSLAASCQRWWSDNAVSVTATFLPTEKSQIPAVLRAFDGQLKSLSFLPADTSTYPQMPYQMCSLEHWERLRENIMPVDWTGLYNDGSFAEAGESGCTNDVCEIKR